jgi:hypothetical protein
MKENTPVYVQHLGSRFDVLPEKVRAFHRLQGKHELTGHVTIKGAETLVGRLLAVVMGFPAEAPNQPFSFTLDASPAQEVWTRLFPTRTMRSCLSVRDKYLTEAFGPIRLFFEIEAEPARLEMHLKRMTFLGIPVPRVFQPGVKAFEREAEGCFQFNIEASWPGSKRVVAYVGTLRLPEDA